MPKLYVCFLSADSDLLQKHVLNMAAAWMAPTTEDGKPMVHSEVFFPQHDNDSSVIGKSCGIHYGGQVFVQEKRFSRSNWIFRALTCTDAQYNKMLRYCNSQRGGGFNYMGYFTPCGSSIESRLNSDGPQQWYCSELSTAILHNGGIIDDSDVPVCSTHPQLLYDKMVPMTFADCGRNIDLQCLKI